MPEAEATPPTVGPPDPIFVSVAEAARILGLSRAQVYHLCDAQQIETRYFGKRRLVVLDALHRFAEALPTGHAS